MPRVPSVSLNTQQQPTFQAAQIAPVEDVTTKNIVSAGQGVGQLGKATLTYGDYLEDSINDAMVTKAWNDYRTNAMRMANDPETGFLSQKGQSALEGYKAARENLQGLIKSQESGLLNDFQRQMFRQQAQLYESEMMLRYDAHAAKETTDFKLNETNRQIDSFAQDYALLMANPIPDVTDPDGNPMPQDPTQQRLRPEAVLQAAQDKLRESWKLQKISPDSEEAKGQMRKLTSGMHKSAIEAFMAKDDDASASSYLEQHRAEMRGDDVVSLQSRLTNLQDANRAKEANRTGIRLVEQVSDNFVGYDAQYNELFSMYMRKDNPISTQEFNAAVAYLNNRSREADGKQAAEADEILNAAEALALSSHYRTVDEFFDAYKNQDIAGKLHKAGQYVEFVQNYGTYKYVKTDPAALDELERSIDSGSFAAMNERDFRNRYRTRLSTPDYDFYKSQLKPKELRSQGEQRIITEREAAKNLLERQPWYVNADQIKSRFPKDSKAASDAAAQNGIIAGLWQDRINAILQEQEHLTGNLTFDQKLYKAHEQLLKEPMVNVNLPWLVTDKNPTGSMVLPRSIVDPTRVEGTVSVSSIKDEVDYKLWSAWQYHFASLGKDASDIAIAEEFQKRKMLAEKYPQRINPDVVTKELGIDLRLIAENMPGDVEGLMLQSGLPSAINEDGSLAAWFVHLYVKDWLAQRPATRTSSPYDGMDTSTAMAYHEWSLGVPTRFNMLYKPDSPWKLNPYKEYWLMRNNAMRSDSTK